MDLKATLARVVPAERLLDRRIDRIAFANDASVYRLVPRIVALPETIEEVQGLLRASRELRVPLTFRAAGTSLSGQAVTDGILAVLSRGWRKIEITDDGRRVRVEPGVIGGVVNQHLARHGAKIGPDPASINACMMGGILANNSSGMCCGVVQNAYRTLHAMRFVLPDGTLVDTERGAERFERDAPGLARALSELRARVAGHPALAERIRRKYSMKNTMGYSLNAFLDFERPLDILSHLMIGSEGTLGFIAEAVLNTVPDYPVKYTGLLFFEDVPRACASIAALRDSGARALELMDRASLRSIAGRPGVPELIAGLPPRAAALLVEYQCETEAELSERRAACDALLPRFPLIAEPDFTRDPRRQAELWSVRKGLIPSVGAMRARGTSFIIEDVVFPVERLADGVADLQGLLAEFGYDDAIVFGHAKDGNLHFVLTQSFRDAADVERYDGFMRALARVVAGRYGGALKAEHGTGRNMAPFVVAEWGEAAYRVMREVKRLVDPEGLLNPGVVINDDPAAHVTSLKALPTVEQEVDACIECGFCERMCPSRDLTLTPRQRIVVRREMAALRERDPADPRLRELEGDYRYDAVDTCATDGLCALACPVGIDTGQLVKRLRRSDRSAAVQELARLAADRFGVVETLARGLLRAGFRDLPRSARPPRPASPTDLASADAIYFPTCVTRVLGYDSRPPLAETILTVCARAGVTLAIPPDTTGKCCGLPFSSKGLQAASDLSSESTLAAMWEWSRHGSLPIVIDTSPCAQTLVQRRPDAYPGLTILDAVEFAHDRLLPRLSLRPVGGTVVLHPVCSVQKMNLAGTLESIARACAEAAETPIHAGCCGFAGDRGLTHPELTASALTMESREVATTSATGHFSSSRTCEIGLSRATGEEYRSFWYLLEEATRPERA